MTPLLKADGGYHNFVDVAERIKLTAHAWLADYHRSADSLNQGQEGNQAY